MFKFDEMKVKVTFTEDVLGMMPGSEKIYEEFIASRAPKVELAEEETNEFSEEDEKKTMTVFPKLDNGVPFFWDYQIKGFFKDSCGMLKRYSGSKSAAMKAYKKIIDGNVFIKERRIPINVQGEIGTKQRPLRAATPQGERIALACSETIPAGSTMEFTIEMLDPSLKDTVVEWLNYGRWHGMGQWRNASWGRFTYEIL